MICIDTTKNSVIGPAANVPLPAHLAWEPFRPMCGADRPDQKTTCDFQHVTCERCIELCGIEELNHDTNGRA